MHSTLSGDRRQSLQKEDRELARDARALQKAAAHAPATRREAERLQGEAQKALVEAEALKLQARWEDLAVRLDGKCQAEPERLQDLHLLDGILARGRQDVQCASGECQEDGCRASPPEGQGEEGGGAGLHWERNEHVHSHKLIIADHDQYAAKSSTSRLMAGRL